MKHKLRTMAAVSSGGVVVRSPSASSHAAFEIVLVGQSHSGRWGLPKGAPSDAETLEETALREVREETGIQARIVHSLGHIEYWFAARAIRFHKTVHFYLMEAVGGDIAHHDMEHDLIGWFTIAEAYRRMSYANEKEILRRAEEKLSNVPEQLRGTKDLTGDG